MNNILSTIEKIDFPPLKTFDTPNSLLRSLTTTYDALFYIPFDRCGGS